MQRVFRRDGNEIREQNTENTEMNGIKHKNLDSFPIDSNPHFGLRFVRIPFPCPAIITFSVCVLCVRIRITSGVVVWLTQIAACGQSVYVIQLHAIATAKLKRYLNHVTLYCYCT